MGWEYINMSVLYIVEIQDFEQPLQNDLLQLLSMERLNKIQRYYLVQDRLRSYLGALLVRYSICKEMDINNELLHFILSEFGKPEVQMLDGRQVFFSLSHSGNYVTCLTDRYVCGTDVEKVKCGNYHIAESYFHEMENKKIQSCQDQVKASNYFTFLWTMKEAYLKALGVGLSRSLSSFQVEERNNKIRILDLDVNSINFPICDSFTTNDGYVLSSVSQTKIIYRKMSDAFFLEQVRKEMLEQ